MSIRIDIVKNKKVMKHSKIIVKFTVLLLFSIGLKQTNAQQDRVDSVIALLNKSYTSKGLDTLTFNNARQLITTTVLTEEQILQLEKVADRFTKGQNEDLCYAVKFMVMVSLSLSDKFKAIEYGKLNIQKLENSSTPHAKLLANNFLRQLRLPYRNSTKLADGFQFYTEKLNQYKKANDSIGLSSCYYVLSGFYRQIGLFEPAMYNMKKSISYLDSSDFTSKPYLYFYEAYGKRSWINNQFIIVDFYVVMGEYEKAKKLGELTLQTAIDYYKAGEKRAKGTGLLLTFGARHLAYANILTNQLDSVDYLLKIAENAVGDLPSIDASAVLLQYRSLYDIKRGAYAEADSLLQLCWKLIDKFQIPVGPSAGFVEPDYYLALLRIEQKKYTEAIALLLKNNDRVKGIRPNLLRDYKLLASLYEKIGDNIKAKEAYKAFINLQDSISVDQSKFRALSFETEQQITDNEIAISKLESANKLSAVTRNFTIGIAALFFMLAGMIYYRFKSKQKANLVLHEQKAKIESTLAELTSTQSQLIQSEKMASLGELTAGIAHEIQNPLNFVNNFSEVSTELVKEMVQEVEKGNTEEVKAIANDVVQNLEKINHHGQRASDIVKGMLQHSRSSSGVKEPTDINALADEYFRLAFHGLRAKDKTFNATMKTDFDESIGNISIIPQDIGRVVLNLITNAFYAVNEKSKQGIADYEPTVSVSIKRINNQVVIRVTDNGNGIPPNILDKIFQPFFTTKPTGQGTGLGLSLSYDIVKAHGGELRVETKEWIGTEFIIQLPIV
jgi:signal transduction histidine kinase